MQPETILLYSINSVISNFHPWFVGSGYFLLLFFISIVFFLFFKKDSLFNVQPLLLFSSTNKVFKDFSSSYLIISNDNTILKRKKISTENKNLDSFFHNSPIAMLRVSSKGKILLFNNVFSNLIEIKDEHEIEKLNYFNNKIRDYFGSVKIKYFVEDKIDSQIETTWQLKGKVIHVRESIKVVHNNDGYVYDITIEDISDEKRSERILQINEEKFKTVIDQVPVGIYKVINSGEFVFANLHLANLIGFSSTEQLKGCVASDFVLNIQEYKDYIKKQIKKGSSSYCVEFQLKRIDGKCIWVQDSARIIYDTSDEVLFFEGIIEDISHRKNSEQEIKQLITAINQISEAIIITDTFGVIKYANPTLEKITQYSVAEVLDKNFIDINKFQSTDFYFNNIIKSVSNGNTWSGSITNKRKDDSIYYENIAISPVKNNDGTIINFVIVMRDVTDERLLEQQLRHSQKVQAIGTLAGGIAHDFNNILMGMQIYTEILLKKISADTPENGLLKKIFSAETRAKELINQILTFSRITGDERQPLQINIYVKEALKLIKTTFPSTLKFETKINDCGNILGNPAQIDQIIMNLCTNANHAMEGMGTITIELKRLNYIEHADGKQENTNNDWVCLKVKDSGCGIEKKIAERIFEPFFTTKPVGKGTGLGLASVHGIVKQYGGEIYFKSEIGIGTIFYIYLPAL